MDEGDIHKTNTAIFRKMGSSKESVFLLGHHDRDCGSGIENFTKRHFSFFLAMLDFSCVLICFGYLFMLAKTAIYVVDIVKDVKFIFLLNSVRLEKSSSSLIGQN